MYKKTSSDGTNAANDAANAGNAVKNHHAEALLKHAPISQHPEFELLKNQAIPALNMVLQHYRHRTTQAPHFHFVAEDDENVFMAALKTIPKDSTGVAHILEHTVLCGSERFPVRDPFFMMLRRSLNTFMNAFTSSDWTAYPFATQNRQDFDNLLEVYLDAVFFSRLDELDFAQEGHRLEFSKPNDPNSRLEFKGVVFNEMKGAMSAPSSILWHSLTKHLYPTSTYHFNSGGEPEQITQLSYAQLKEFYKTHYHPSNALFFTYGNIPAEAHHDVFQDKVLSRFDFAPVARHVLPEMRYHAPLEVIEHYPVDDKTDEECAEMSHVVLAWLLGDASDHDEYLQARLLANVLFANSAAPLTKALETTTLGKAPSPLCGLDDDHRELVFVCGLEGAKSEDADAIEALILSVLEEVAQHGVPQSEIEAVLHQLELHQREVTGAHYPYGLSLILRILSVAMHHGDVYATLDLENALMRLRKHTEDPNFIQSLARKLLLNNRHRVRLTLQPDPELSQHRSEYECAVLEKIKAKLSNAEKKQIIMNTEQLKQRQQHKDDDRILPKLTLQAVPETLELPSGKKIEFATQVCHVYAQGTNGLVYQDIVVPVNQQMIANFKVLPYLLSCFSEVGVGKKNYLETQAWQSQVSGGIGLRFQYSAPIDLRDSLHAAMILSGKGLFRNAKPLMELLHESWYTVRFDETRRIKDLFSQMQARLNQSITASGHQFAMMAASSSLSPAAYLSHQITGLQCIQNLNVLMKQVKNADDLNAICVQMQAIQASVQGVQPEFLMIAQEEQLSHLLGDLKEMWPKKALMIQNDASFNCAMEVIAPEQLWIANTEVNFCAKAFPTVPYDHEDAAPLTILAEYLRNGYLHRVIREQGGAYGGGASHDTDSGIFRFYSYRDPRLVETLADFDNAVDWVLKEATEDESLEQAILGVFSKMDKPSSPAGQARRAFYNQYFGLTDPVRQRFRHRLLNCQMDDLKRVAKLYLRPELGKTAVVTNRVMYEKVGSLGMAVMEV